MHLRKSGAVNYLKWIRKFRGAKRAKARTYARRYSVTKKKKQAA